MDPFMPVGEQARWRIVYDLLAATPTGDVLSYEEMALSLGVDQYKERHIIQQAIHRAAKEHEKVDKRAIEVVRNQGYRVIQPEEHIRLARKWQGKSSKALVAGRSKVVNVDLNALTPELRALYLASDRAFALQADYIHRLDIRQRGMEQALATIVVRSDRSEAEIAELQERLARLERRQAS